MAYYYYYLHFLSLLLPLLAVAALINRPAGCKSRCGNVNIRYPFGIGKGCALNDNFDVSCNTSTIPAIPYLTNLANRSQIIEIRISTAQVLVRYPYLAGSRYEKEEEEDDDEDWPAVETWTLNINLTHTPYTLSERNSITVVGCDDFLRIDGINSEVFAGCLSLCNDNTTWGNCPADGTSGNGCCQYPIPKGQAYLSLKFSDMHEHSRALLKKRLFRCGYAFVGEKQKRPFSYELTGLNNRTAFQIQHPGAISRPLVMDWRIGNQNCTPKLMNSPSYACKSYSYCVNVSQGPVGYTCRCNKGYEGNPYLIDRCMDIDECKTRPIVCKSPSHCKNTAGGYECWCSIGYRYSNDRGCIPSTWINASIAIPVSAVGTILLLTMCFWLRKILQQRDKRRRNFKRNGGLLLQQQTNGWAFAKSNIFTLKELEKATDFFNANQILGEGGRGAVYKGLFPNGRIVAIKKAKLVDLSQLEEFLNEMIVLSQINNRHVVKLLGCCLESDVPLLVYQFIPNGTLFDLIHDPLSVEFTVTWNMRLKIAVDIAGAIAYLHHTCDIPIYHRDIKSNNILLDEKYVAKVSDFGCSRLVPVDQTHLTTRVMGTFGYLDPEYFRSSQFTDKSDVYSFGVVLVELLTGKMAVSSTGSDEERSLATHFLNSMDGNNVEKILDDQVIQGAMEEVMAVAEIAKWCLNSKGKLRPSMKTVATELEGIRKPQKGIVVEVVDHWDTGTEDDEPMSLIVPNNDYSWTSAPNFPPSPAISHPFMKDFHSE